jgi:hypothetical protein
LQDNAFDPKLNAEHLRISSARRTSLSAYDQNVAGELLDEFA